MTQLRSRALSDILANVYVVLHHASLGKRRPCQRLNVVCEGTFRYDMPHHVVAI